VRITVTVTGTVTVPGASFIVTDIRVTQADCSGIRVINDVSVTGSLPCGPADPSRGRPGIQRPNGTTESVPARPSAAAGRGYQFLWSTLTGPTSIYHPYHVMMSQRGPGARRVSLLRTVTV
jgi:hypothetical protein